MHLSLGFSLQKTHNCRSWSFIPDLTVPKYGITTFQNFNRVNKTVVHNSTCFLASTESDESYQYHCHIRKLLSCLSFFILPFHASNTLFKLLGEIINSQKCHNFCCIIIFVLSIFAHSTHYQASHRSHGTSVPKILHLYYICSQSPPLLAS